MDTRASTRTRLSVLPVFFALLFNVMAPVVATALPEAAPDVLQPGAIKASDDAASGTQFSLQGCRLEAGDFIEATTTCTDAGYTPGNLGKEWAELDLVPYRLAIGSPVDQSFTIAVAADYKYFDNDGNDYLGYDVVDGFVLNTSLSEGACSITKVGGNQISGDDAAGGIDETIYQFVTITAGEDATCVFDLYMRLALGSHSFSGASLHGYLLDHDLDPLGERRVSIFVKEIAPQELAKTMSATRGSAFAWSITKTANPTSLHFANTCVPDAESRQASVSVTVSWTRSGPTGSGDVTVTTEITATNPAERSILVNIEDRIYEGTGQDPADQFGGTFAASATIPANSSNTWTHTVTGESAATHFNDVATATYTDVLTGVAVPGNTEARAEADVTLSTDAAEHASVAITDTEAITGSGLSFSVDSSTGAGGTFTTTGGTPYTLGTVTTGPVNWMSGTQTAGGSVTFNKTVYADQGTTTESGLLSDTANVLSGGESIASANLDVPITSDATVSLTIDKTIPAGALRTGESVTFEFEVFAGSEASGTPIATETITFDAGSLTEKSVTVAGLAPGTYTVHEVPEPNWASLPDQTATIELPDCSATVEFDNTELIPNLEATKEADDASVSAGSRIGFEITVTNVDGIGVGIAKDVEVEDLLPGGDGIDWEIAADSDDGGDCSISGSLGSELLECDFGDLAPGASASVHVVSDTTADSCGVYENTATISASNLDEPLMPKDDTEVLCAEIELTKTPVPDGEANDPADNDVVVGEEASFTLVTRNIGEGTATGVVLTDALPAVALGWDITASTWPDGDAACVITGVDGAPQTLTCGGTEGVSLGAGAQLSVTVSTTTTSADCGQLDNDAQVITANDGSDTDAGEIDVLCPDASVTKTAETPTINAGEPATFTITVSAGGTGDSTNVEVTDAVPAGHTWTVTGDISDCVGFSAGDTELVLAGGETLSCIYPTLENGTSKSLTITSTSTTDDCADGISNTVTIEADADVDTSDESNQATATIEVECPDLRLLKSGSSTVVAGASVDFVIEVDNIGEGDAKDVVMLDDLPELAGGTWSIVATDGIDEADCQILDLPSDDPDAETVLRCALDELAAGDGFSVTVRATTAVGDCPMLSNDALVEASNEDADDTANNADSHDIAVECPDVSITKEATVPSVSAGQAATFEIVVSVDGEGNSANVELIDELEGDVDDWTFEVTGDGSNDDCSISLEGVLKCLFGTLEPGAEITISLTYQTDSGDCPEIGNAASVSATADVDPSNNQAERVTIDVNCPNLVVEKRQVDETGEPTDEPISAGDTAYFEIEVTNLGAGTAFGFELLDEPESGTWTVLEDGGLTCPTEIGPTGATCTAESLAPGTYTLLLSYETSIEDCGQLPNLVTVSADNEPQESVTSENSDSATIVVECPGLNILKRQVDENGDPTDDPIIAGETAYFEIVVWNTGPGEAKDVVVEDDLPGGLTWELEITDGDGECMPASSLEEGGEVQMSFICELGDLEADESVTILVWAETDRTDCGPLLNTATVDGSNNDDDVPPATATIDVSCPELALEKDNDTDGPVLPGTVVTYTLTLTVSDEGLENGEATDVTVVDVLPDGLEDPTAFDPAATFDAASRTITWDLGTLGEGTYELTYQAIVSEDAEHGDELVNVAAATSPDSQCPDLDSLGPECEATSTVTVRVPTLVIDKAADADLITITLDADGEIDSVDPEVVTWTLTYTLTNGPVTNAVISDELPEGLVYVGGSASDGGVYDAATKTLTWTFATLSESGSVTFETEVDPETISRADPTVNVALIASDQTPEDEGEDEVTVTVEQELGGNPTPTPKPLPDTATGIGLGGHPITIPVELLAVAFLGSLGALALANVRASRGRRR